MGKVGIGATVKACALGGFLVTAVSRAHNKAFCFLQLLPSLLSSFPVLQSLFIAFLPSSLLLLLTPHSWHRMALPDITFAWATES